MKVKTDGTSERALLDHDRALLERWAERHNYRRENPLSVQERIQFYIDSAEARLQIAMRDLENEPDVETLVKQLKNESDKSAQRKTLRKIEKLANAPGDLRAMIREAKTAFELFQAGDIERALIAYDHMHGHRAKYNLPLQEKASQGQRGEGKIGKYGTVRKILTWLYQNSPENTDIFEKWRKTRKIIETGNGEKWSLVAYRIDETIDALRNVKPEDYEYFYADRRDEDAELDLIPVTVGSIKTALSRIRKDI